KGLEDIVEAGPSSLLTADPLLSLP
ncbi:hypothetical protein QOZ94_004294, partial [Xanthobacter agilis]|nr:hypothetical protein [Xanthobacter agilis]MDQ0507470.1 hypothetical protein [Xanthobacter agilis]